MNKNAKKEIDAVLKQIPKEVVFTNNEFTTLFATDMAEKYKLDFNDVLEYILQKLSGQ